MMTQLDAGIVSDFVGVEVKKCSKCGIVKAKSEFYKNTGRNDGLQSECKECKKTTNAAWAAANPERVKATKVAWYTANPEKVKLTNAAWAAANAEKVKAYRVTYHAANPKKYSARNAAWAAANPERVRAMSAAYRAANPEKVRLSRLTARQADPHHQWALGTFNSHRKKYNIVITLDELIAMARGTTHCRWCGVELDWQGKSNQDSLPSWDRVFNGSRMSKDNTEIICLACNKAKGNKAKPDFEEHCIKIALRTGKVVPATPAP